MCIVSKDLSATKYVICDHHNEAHGAVAYGGTGGYDAWCA